MHGCPRLQKGPQQVPGTGAMGGAHESLSVSVQRGAQDRPHQVIVLVTCEGEEQVFMAPAGGGRPLAPATFCGFCGCRTWSRSPAHPACPAGEAGLAVGRARAFGDTLEHPSAWTPQGPQNTAPPRTLLWGPCASLWSPRKNRSWLLVLRAMVAKPDSWDLSSFFLSKSSCTSHMLAHFCSLCAGDAWVGLTGGGD